jgi:hypothetical protein
VKISCTILSASFPFPTFLTTSTKNKLPLPNLPHNINKELPTVRRCLLFTAIQPLCEELLKTTRWIFKGDLNASPSCGETKISGYFLSTRSKIPSPQAARSRM